jgi:hypothetical protein
MTDNNTFIPNQKAVTSDCLYNLKPSSVNCRSYRCSIQSNKATFSPGDLAAFIIPARRNCFLDTSQSYIKVTIKNNEDADNNITYDSCGSCVFNRLDVWHGSNLLESIHSYNILYNFLIDVQLNLATRTGMSPAYGTSSELSNTNIYRKGAQLSFGNTHSTCMPILSGVVGCLSEKMLPLSLKDDIRLEFTIEQNDIAFVYATDPTTQWSIINMELELCIVEMSSEGLKMIEQVTPFSNPVYLHTSSYRHYISPLPKSTNGVYSTVVSSNFASLKSLYCLPRRNTEIKDSMSYSLSSRVNPNISQYCWKFGSLIVPSKSVNLKNGYSEGFMELQRAFHSINNAEFCGSFGAFSYYVGDVEDTTIGDVNSKSTVSAPLDSEYSYQNGFAIAQELESFAQRSDQILSGMNTSTLESNISFEATIVSAAALTSDYTLDFYAFYDMILTLQNGYLTVKF